ncbi:MAG: histidine--tRNA ligase [Clostridia bacterium]|nr:histidine--tRNA ligase [Clostridia bacterium]
MKITPVKGTADYLPSEVLIRDYLQNTILETYRSCGFERITTPIIEDIENLDKSDGGENLNLIFKILKRGEKMDEAVASGDPKELCDMGLRYDLTLPLTRYYANNRAKLPSPFKVIQIDKVYRAERPQKGRMREFVQCDIDIIGSNSYTAEVELITTTAKALQAIGFDGFNIRINDRQLLRAIIMSAGFAAEDCDSVCISLDKLDKIAAEGVRAELVDKGFAADKADRLMAAIAVSPFTLDDAQRICGELDCIANLRRIMELANSLAGGKYAVEYDMTLVRGQGYYTGTVFEISSPKFRGAIGGGGRYDNLIGKFLGESIPAVGFSIGFERIAGILLEQNYQIPTRKQRLAVIYNDENFPEALRRAETLRAQYDVTLVEAPKKLGKLFGKLEEAGYAGCAIMGQDELKLFGN